MYTSSLLFHLLLWTFGVWCGYIMVLTFLLPSSYLYVHLYSCITNQVHTLTHTHRAMVEPPPTNQRWSLTTSLPGWVTPLDGCLPPCSPTTLSSVDDKWSPSTTRGISSSSDFTGIIYHYHNNILL